MFVYLITNRVNSKRYVGQTTRNLSERWLEHLQDSKYIQGSLISRAIRKYGKKNFRFELISCCSNRMDLDNTERFLIWLFGSAKSSLGYNPIIGSSRDFFTKPIPRATSPLSKNEIHEIHHQMRLKELQRSNDRHFQRLQFSGGSHPKRPSTGIISNFNLNTTNSHDEYSTTSIFENYLKRRGTPFSYIKKHKV